MFKKYSFTHFINCQLLVIMSCLLATTNACNIWSTSECRDRITKADIELMKGDDYTKQELYKYCDKGKEYVDCINDKLKCCDYRPDLTKSLQIFEKKLEEYAWKLAPYCSGLGVTNVAYYKCKTTTSKTTTTTTITKRKSSMPYCQIEKVSFS